MESHSKLYSMRRLHTSACVALLSILVSLPQASAFGLKKPKASATPAVKTTSDTKDITPVIDDILKQPVKPQPLQGGVEATDAAAPIGGDPLKGTADDTGGTKLNGNAQDGGPIRGIPMQPKPDTLPVLKGNASVLNGKVSEDPDMQDRELMVEWDRWRNKFLRAVQLQVQVGVNHPDDWDEDARPKIVIDPYTGQPTVQPRFPMGTEAWFTCDVTSDKRVKNLSIVKPSGHPAYDKAVLEGVRALEGTSLLNYPTGSHRITVSQTAAIRVGTSADYQYHHFGDVEHVRGQ
jgi:TonB family protein